MTFDATLLSRVEDAGLNASAPPRQFWLDGWIVRTNPGKARRARCINAVAPGRLPWADKMRLAQALLDEAGLPLLVRTTRFTLPGSLDDELAKAGWPAADETQVLVRPDLLSQTQQDTNSTMPPAGLVWQRLSHEAYAAAVGMLRGSSPEEIKAHEERLRFSPTPYRGHALLREDGQVLCCGQSAREGTMVGLYDVYTHPSARSQGLSRWLCGRLLTLAAEAGATLAYLQVETDNAAAQKVYRRLGFQYGYSYHYRQPPAGR